MEIRPTGARPRWPSAPVKPGGGSGKRDLGVVTANTSAGPFLIGNQTYTRAEDILISAQFGGINSLTASTQVITVSPAALAKYGVFEPVSASVNTPFSITITAFDAFGNTRSGAAIVNLTANGGTGALGTTVANLALSSNPVILSQTYNTAQAIKIVANDGTKNSVLAETTLLTVNALPTPTPTFTPTYSPTSTITLTPTISPTPTITLTLTYSVTETFSNSPSPRFHRPRLSPLPLSSSVTTTHTLTHTDTFTVTPTFTVTLSSSVTSTFTPTSFADFHSDHDPYPDPHRYFYRDPDLYRHSLGDPH